MDLLLYIVIGLVAAGVAWWMLAGRGKALPAAPPREALPAEREPEPERAVEREAGPEPEIEIDRDRDREREGAIAKAPADEAAAAKERPRFAPPPRTGAAAVPLPVEKPRAPARADASKPRASEREQYTKGLAKTRGGFVAKLARLFRGRPKVDANLRDQIEEVLFTADIGTATATKLLERVTEVLDKKDVADPDAVWSVIRQACLDIVDIRDSGAPALGVADVPRPYVLLAIGVNGVGKTTTLGKLAARHAALGRRVLLVAGDTFRAAATEQLDVWARRVGCDIHTGADKADPSAVIFDGIARAHREGHDVVLCDTAGRLHTKKELMDELGKVGRSAAKALAKAQPGAQDDAPRHDTFLVLDATIGQNALAQAQMFKETMRFSGLVVTKLDGTAKGGVVLGICDELGIPIRYVGIGEGVDDLREFSPEDFVDALLARDDAGQAVA